MNRFYFWTYVDKSKKYVIDINPEYDCYFLLSKKEAKQFFISEEEAISFLKNIDWSQFDSYSQKEFEENFILKKCYIEQSSLLGMLETIYGSYSINEAPSIYLCNE